MGHGIACPCCVQVLPLGKRGEGAPGVTPEGIPNEYSPVINIYQVFDTVLTQAASHGARPARGPAGVTVGVRPDSGARFGI